VGRMVADAELLTDQVCDAPARPDRATKAEGCGALGQQSDEVRALVWRQQGRSTGRRVILQRRDPLGCRPCEPLTDRTLRDAQRLRNVLVCPSLQVQLPGPATAAFVPTHRLVVIACTHVLSAQHIPAHDY
jgi:hypothetical protein